MAHVRQVTVGVPTNIALIKYWGKRDAALNLPINSSVSLTLHTDDLRTTTTVTASLAFEADRLWLNGREEEVGGNARVQAVLREVRARGGDLCDPSTGAVLVPAAEWATASVRVVSENNFPTAARA